MLKCPCFTFSDVVIPSGSSHQGTDSYTDLVTNIDLNQSPSLEPAKQKRRLSEARDSAVFQHTKLLLPLAWQMSIGREERLFLPS